MMLVEFYAPWCAVCKKFAPEYEAVARSRKAQVPAIPLAKVDATANTQLKNRYSIDTFPTLKFFKDGQPVEDYKGEHTRAGIDTFLVRQSKAPVEVSTLAEAEAFLNEHKVAVLGACASDDAQLVSVS